MRKLLIFWELPQFILALILLIIFKKRIFKTEKYIDANIYFVKGFPGGISLSYLIFLNEPLSTNHLIVKRNKIIGNWTDILEISCKGKPIFLCKNGRINE